MPSGARVNTLGFMSHGASGEMSGETNGCVFLYQAGRERAVIRLQSRPRSIHMEALLVSIGVVALAEIGDKTQLLTLVLAARYKKPWAIVGGIFVATLANHAVAGALGAWLATLIGPDARRWVLSASFIAMAAWVLFPDKLENAGAQRIDARGVFLTTAVLFFLVEIGDKTQIATVALAARFDAIEAVVIGTTLGMLLANAPVSFCGDQIAKRLPLRVVRLIAALVFAALGIGAVMLG